MSGVELRLLGDIEASVDGASAEIGGPRPRAVLALLASSPGAVVSSDRLIDGVWGAEPPASAANSLQTYVSRLRKALGADVIASTPSGYRLDLRPDQVDTWRFEQLVADGSERLRAGDPAGAASRLHDALGLWRGEPFGGLGYESWADAEAARLSELRLTATEERVEADLAVGRHADIVAELELFVLRHPLRERARGQLMVALYRSGRHADALEAFRLGREALVEELGLEPGRNLKDLEQAILRQDPQLDLGPLPAPAPRGAPSPSVLIGRDEELARLSELLDGLEQGRGALALVTGEPGIGKTKLAEETCRRAGERGLTYVWGRCWEAGGAPPYWPWSQAIRSAIAQWGREWLTEALGDDLPHVAPALPSLRALYPGLPEPPPIEDLAGPDRFRVFEAAQTFLRLTTAKRPLVLVLEDMHAADEISLLLLRYLAPQLHTLGVLAVVTARDTDLWDRPPAADAVAEVERHADARVELQGLGRSAIEAFVEQALPGPPSPHVLDWIAVETEGNPLYLGEFVRALDGADAAGERATRLALGAGVRELISQRLRRLTPPCRERMETAAVIGREFDLPTLTVAAEGPADATLEALDEAIAARVVSDVRDDLGRFRFSHALLREGLYQELRPSRRLRLHLRVGEALEQLFEADPDPHLAELAHHFCEAAPAGQAAKAVSYAERAAERAVGNLAFEDAARLYRLALLTASIAGGSTAATRARICLGLGDAYARIGDAGPAREAFAQAAETARSAGLPTELGEAALGVGGRFAWSRPANEIDLVPLLEEALAGIGDPDSALRARLLARLSGALRDSPSPEPRAELSAEAVAIARRLGDPRTLAYALEARWAATWWPDNAQDRLAISEELIELAPRTRDRERHWEAHHLRMCVLYELGRLADADAALERARLMALDMGQPANEAVLDAIRAVRALSEGRFEDAEALSAHVQQLEAGAFTSELAGSRTTHLFLLHRERGTLAEVEPALRAWLVSSPTRSPVRALLAYAHARLGRPGDARQELRALGADEGFASLPRDNEWLFTLSLLAEVCALLDDAGPAEPLYGLLTPYAERFALNLGDGDLGSVHRPLGLLADRLGETEAAIGHLRAAIDANDAAGYRPFSAWSRFELARILDGATEAGALRADALTTARELGMAELARTIEREVPATR